MAKTGGYKGKLLEEVKSLSEGRVKAVADFAAYLKEREEWEATGEIMGNEELVQQVKESRKAWAEDRKGEFVSLYLNRTIVIPSRLTLFLYFGLVALTCMLTIDPANSQIVSEEVPRSVPQSCAPVPP